MPRWESSASLSDRFAGCLLGLAVGDALGGPYESLTPTDLYFQFGTPDVIVRNPSGDTLYYTDDTEMMIGVAETLIDCGHIEGAQLLAAAVAHASRTATFDRKGFYHELLTLATTEEFRWHLEMAVALKPSDPVSGLGSTLHAHRSVVTAMACFAATPTDFEFAVGRAIGLGDDTDTVAAMTGALVGALAGVGAIPTERIAQLEEQGKGGRYIAELATKLYARYAT